VTRDVYTGFWWRNVWERDDLEDAGVDGSIILRWIFRKWDVGVCTGSICLRIGTDSGTCECGNKPSGAMKCGEFLDRLKAGSLLRKDCAPWTKYERLFRMHKPTDIKSFGSIHDSTLS